MQHVGFQKLNLFEFMTGSFLHLYSHPNVPKACWKPASSPCHSPPPLLLVPLLSIRTPESQTHVHSSWSGMLEQQRKHFSPGRRNSATFLPTEKHLLRRLWMLHYVPWTDPHHISGMLVVTHSGGNSPLASLQPANRCLLNLRAHQQSLLQNQHVGVSCISPLVNPKVPAVQAFHERMSQIRDASKGTPSHFSLELGALNHLVLFWKSPCLKILYCSFFQCVLA